MSQETVAASTPLRVTRVEIRPRPGEPDPLAEGVLSQARVAMSHVQSVATARLYLIESALDDQRLEQVAQELLADPVNQRAQLGAAPAPPAEAGAVIEVHYLPGVMDPVAQSTQDAIAEMLGGASGSLQVRTGFRYDLSFTHGATPPAPEQLQRFAEKHLANPVIQQICLQPSTPGSFPHGSQYRLRLTHVPIRELDDAGLTRLSREGHLFLSLPEMTAVRDYYRAAGREPTDIELETLAQTWSEHCVHKTLKSRMHYQEEGGISIPGLTGPEAAQRPGHQLEADGSLTIDNLLKSTIAAATKKLMEDPELGQWCVSVFKDNAGIVQFDDQDGVCIKVETHNHPSAIEPYGGAATGIGGCIRDVMGTGLSARPIANMDVFAVAFPQTRDVPKGVIAPKRTLQQVMAGVRDYGNRMGIPTVNGAVLFHDGYLANPLVFAGCVGLIPLDKCFGAAQPGDHIIALGGQTGRDGIHGATFSSAELTDTHAEEFAHAVQIGNAITQKKMMDVILQARDQEGGPLFRAITDCGAGGFSSAVGEMGQQTGALVNLDAAPLKYQGLSYTEIWISEAQERMVLAVPPEQLEKLAAMCAAEDVQLCDLGTFGQQDAQGQAELVLNYQGQEVGRLSMHLLHEGIPTPVRKAQWKSGPAATGRMERGDTGHPLGTRPSLEEALLKLLAHPDIASKHWIIRQYDHEVQGGSVIKPLVGPNQEGPSDAAVLRPKLSSPRAIAIGCGAAPRLADQRLASDADAYWMALAAIDEAVRNVICVGADPKRIALLDNFCWPSCQDPQNLASLVRAAEACYDGSMAYRAPFVSGKDSLNNQFVSEDGRLIAIPPTLLITALGIVPQALRCRSMDAKQAGNFLLLVGETDSAMGASHYQEISGDLQVDLRIPRVDLTTAPATAAAVADLIARGLVHSAHDCSEGGLLVAAAEMAFAGDLGLDLDLTALPAQRELDDWAAAFAQTPARYLLEIAPAQLDAAARLLRQAQIPAGQVGAFAGHKRLTLRCPQHGRILDVGIDQLRHAWLSPLDW